MPSRTLCASEITRSAKWAHEGVAHHVNLHSEQLRPRFVRHQGKVSIDVDRHDFAKGSPENPWGEVIGEFSARVAEHLGPAHGLFVPRFSTTGPAERVASEIVLLGAVKNYFRYSVSIRRAASPPSPSNALRSPLPRA